MGLVKCPQCQKSFTSIAGMRQHREEVHTDTEEAESSVSSGNGGAGDEVSAAMNTALKKCPLCDNKYFKVGAEYMGHMNSVHIVAEASSQIRYRCHHCLDKGKTRLFTRISNLKTHIKSFHQSNNDPFVVEKCMICSVTFRNHKDLIAHLPSHNQISRQYKLFQEVRSALKRAVQCYGVQFLPDSCPNIESLQARRDLLTELYSILRNQVAREVGVRVALVAAARYAQLDEAGRLVESTLFYLRSRAISLTPERAGEHLPALMGSLFEEMASRSREIELQASGWTLCYISSLQCELNLMQTAVESAS